MSSGLVPEHCPCCGRPTADNRTHCPDKTPKKWAAECRWITCKCGRIYTVSPGPKEAA